eukprot:624645-Rhodomonas_salina.2
MAVDSGPDAKNPSCTHILNLQRGWTSVLHLGVATLQRLGPFCVLCTRCLLADNAVGVPQCHPVDPRAVREEVIPPGRACPYGLFPPAKKSTLATLRGDAKSGLASRIARNIPRALDVMAVFSRGWIFSVSSLW